MNRRTMWLCIAALWIAIVGIYVALGFLFLRLMEIQTQVERAAPKPPRYERIK